MDTMNQKREPVIRISYDQMEAYITLPLVSMDETYTIDEVLVAAKKYNVTFGVDCDVISDMIKNRVYGSEVLFAKGVRPVDGMDGYYDFNFDYDFSKRPKIREDGTVDYWSIHSVEVVKEGQVIARYIEPIDGKNGTDVAGRTIMAKRGKALPPLAGRGFERSNDGLVYTAEISGKIEKHKNRILILPILEISGDVDVNMGNIDFTGDVVVHGSVKSGARIRATLSITVDGICEGCVLEAGKDIILRGGMIGEGKARLIAKGNLFAKFMEYTEAEVEGFVEADSSVNCDIVSNDKVLFNGGHASIVGGSVYGCAGIEVQKLGNAAYIKTAVYVGVHKKIKMKVAELTRLIEQKQQLLDNINGGIKQIDELCKKNENVQALEDKRLVLIRARVEKLAELTANKTELQKLNGIVERSTNATVIVKEDVYPDVEVWVNDSRVVTKEHVDNVEFIEREGKVVMMSML